MVTRLWRWKNWQRWPKLMPRSMLRDCSLRLDIRSLDHFGVFLDVVRELS